MSKFQFPESWNLDDTSDQPPTSEQISYEINPTILGKPTPRPDKWWSYMLDPWTPPKPDEPAQADPAVPDFSNAPQTDGRPQPAPGLLSGNAAAEVNPFQLAKAQAPPTNPAPPVKPLRTPSTSQQLPLSQSDQDRRATEAKQELNRLASIPISPKPGEEQLLPDDWERRLPKETLDALDAAAKRYDVPRQLLARVLWKESKFDERASAGLNAAGQGIAGLSTDAIADLKKRAVAQGDMTRLRELQAFDRMKGPDAVNMAAEYLRLLHDENSKNWPAAITGYKSGRTAVYGWLKGTGNSIKSNAAQWRQNNAYLRYIFQGDPGAFDKRSIPDIP